MSAVLELAPAAASVRDGRHFVVALLTTWELPELVETAALLTSELLTNSVLHARTAITLTVTRREDGTVEIAVRDRSTYAPRRRRHATDATTGRGMLLLERLAQHWEVNVDEQGKQILFVLGADAEPWAAYSDEAWLDGEL